MMIPKEQLNGEDVRQVVEQTIRDHLNLAIDGYKCDTAVVVNGLVKAAIEGQTIESECEDLALEDGSNTVREHLKLTVRTNREADNGKYSTVRG